MPFKKRKTRKARPVIRKRRSPYRRYKRKVRQQGIKPFVIPYTIPKRLMTKQKYHESLVSGIASPNVAAVVYRTASCFDPQYSIANFTQAAGSIGNMQPGWFDYIKNNYRAYIVRGCKLRIQVIGDGTESVTGQYALVTTSTGVLSTLVDWSQLGHGCGNFIVGQTGSKTWSYKKYIDNYYTTGLSRTSSLLVQSNPMVAGIGTSPTLSPLFQLMVQTADGSGTAKVLVKLNFTYYVEFFDLNLTAGEDT